MHDCLKILSYAAPLFFMILQYFASKICILGGTAIENIIVAHELGFEHQVPGLSLATSLHLLSFSLSLFLSLLLLFSIIICSYFCSFCCCFFVHGAREINFILWAMGMVSCMGCGYGLVCHSIMGGGLTA